MLMILQVRQYLMEAKRQDITRQAIVNITEEALWNLMSACSNTGGLLCAVVETECLNGFKRKLFVLMTNLCVSKYGHGKSGS